MTSVVDPLAVHAFRLELDGVDVLDVLRVEGLVATAAVHRFEEGGVAATDRLGAGPVRWEDLRITWAVGTSAPLAAWRDAFLRDPLAPALGRGGSVAILDGRGDVAARWAWALAWPVRWSGPVLDAGRSALAVEVLSLAHEGLVERSR